MKALYSIAILSALLASSAAFAADNTIKCRENLSVFGAPVAKTFQGDTCPKGWRKDERAHRLATRQ